MIIRFLWPIAALLFATGCTEGIANLSRIIASINPSQGGGNYSYSDSIKATLASEGGGVRIRWSASDFSGATFWVVRTTGYYLNNYNAVSGTLNEDARDFLDTTAVTGTTYFYRVLWYYETEEKYYNSSTQQYEYRTVTHENMSSTVSIPY